MDTSASHKKPIFFDPTRRRAAHVARVVTALGLFAGAVAAVFWASVLAVPVARHDRMRPSRFLPDNALRTTAAINAHPGKSRTGGAGRATPGNNRPPRPPRYAATTASPTAGVVPGRAAGVVGGFYVSWDATSLASLKQHAGEMTHLFPGWLHLDETGGRLVAKDGDISDIEALQVARQNHLVIVPLFNNFSTGLNDFDEDRLHEMLTDPKKRAAVIAQIRSYLLKNHYRGINIDLETEDDGDRALLPLFAQETAAALHPDGLLVTQDTQVGDTAQAAAIARSCDFVVPMIYDLHYASGGDPGPIAPDAWARAELDSFLKAVPANKTVLAIGNYAYNWVKGKPGAQTETFGEAMATAHESQDGNTDGDEDGIVKMDAASRNPYFTFTEDDGKTHEVWFLDAVTAYNFQRYAASKGVSGRALWYVGSEDPALWSFFATRRDTHGTAQDLQTVRYGFEIDFEGEGEVLDIAARPQAGERSLTFDKDGYIAREHFTAYPTTYVVRRSGQHRDAAGKLQKKIALTFDDGPDDEWTPQVLNALQASHIPATFFVIGSNAEKRPDLLQRMWDEGHEIGNHSFYHPNLSRTSETRTRLEIDATQRAIQSAIGRTTPLFRPPYGIDSQPSTGDEMTPVDIAQKMGYVTVAEGIDPRDWEQGAKKRTPGEIAGEIIRAARAGEGNVVLLHDGGGDREATVAALPIAVNTLKAEGYQFVTVTDLMAQKPREAMFPPVTGRQRWLTLVDRQVFGLTSWAGRTLAFLFLFSLAAGAFRLVAVAILALMHQKRERQREATLSLNHLNNDALPTVSVIIAAYNEEKVIVRTVNALLAGGYPHLEVVVVDDGSKDGTSGVVASTFAGEARVRLLTKENGGKASALNRGIALANGEVLVGLDADTLFAADTVHRLARHFANPRVGAVAGNIIVGNRHNILTRWQSVEYVTSQNFDRRAYEMLDAIPVIPGAVGAWRTSAVREAGGYDVDTLAEDADLTWRVRRLGWQMVTDSTAHAYTEAPEGMQDLIKQRFRWTFGTLQTLWKHRDILFRPRYGAFGSVVAPSLWVFQILLPLALPFADLGLIFAALMGNATAAIGYFLFFFCAEFCAALMAFQLDHTARRKRADIAWLFVQRIVYRYLLFYLLVKALATAVRGSRAGWNKLERRGTATVGTAS